MLALVWLSDSARTFMEEESQREWPQETGGVLMGYAATSNQGRRGVVVMSAIAAGPLSTSTRVSFLPDHTWQADQVAKVYADSGRLWTYLGDWHSHPGGRALPSLRDRMTLRAISAHGPARLPDPVMVILGKRSVDDSWDVEAFEHTTRARWIWSSTHVPVLPLSSP